MPILLCARALKRTALLAAACLALPLAAHADPLPLQVVTEELPPYNMTENGKITGMGTEVVQAVLAEAGLAGRFQVVPWARAYDIALHQANVLIYSIARTAERENLFQWVGVVAPTHWSLYSRAADGPRLADLDAARGYQIATVNQDVGEQYLKHMGFEVGRGLASGSRYELNYQKLMQGHVDLWIANDLNADYIARRLGDDPGKTLAISLRLNDVNAGDGLQMAFSRGTPPEVVERARAALATLRANGTYAAIARKWNADAPQ